MSAKSVPSPETPEQPAGESTPRARRNSNPRPKKAAKPAPADDTSLEVVAPVPLTANPQSSKFPDFSEPPDSPAPRADWPEPEPASTESPGAPTHPKRKRRRKKGKGNAAPNAAATTAELLEPAELAESASANPQPHAAPHAPSAPHVPSAPRAPRLKLDPELLAQRAWKIYLSEISEEGVALVGDNDAKELARRCFRLAEIFLVEAQARGH